MNRLKIAGFLLLATIFLALTHALAPLPYRLAYALSGLCAMCAAALLFVDLKTTARIQVGVLFGIGSALLGYAYSHGTQISFADAISRNTLLVSMILSVGFLKLLLEIEKSSDPLPRGRRAYLHTLLGIGVFGSVINVSAPIMICDRLAQETPIDQFVANSATRIFCMCSTWSPFFAGAALILTYVQGVNLLQVMVTGFPMILMALVAVYFSALYLKKDRVDQFIGYSMSLPKLWLPISLTLLVLASQIFVPTTPILVSISLSAIALTVGTLLFRKGPTICFNTLRHHVFDGLPKSVNEVLLFLSAGVLATGLTAFVEASVIDFNVPNFTYQTACYTLAIMILVAALGIHPVIQISVLTPLLMPANPDPELLAITYLFAWGLGTLSSPLSGTHMIFQGRYGIPTWKSAVQNWPFVIPMYFFAIGLLRAHVSFTQ